MPWSLVYVGYFRHWRSSIARLRFVILRGEEALVDLVSCQFVPVGLLFATPAVVVRAVAVVRVAVVVAMVLEVLLVGLAEDVIRRISFPLSSDWLISFYCRALLLLYSYILAPTVCRHPTPFSSLAVPLDPVFIFPARLVPLLIRRLASLHVLSLVPSRRLVLLCGVDHTLLFLELQLIILRLVGLIVLGILLVARVALGAFVVAGIFGP